MRRNVHRKGSVLMEFALTMPILFTLIMIILQFAQIWVARHMVAYAAFCSARSMLSSNPIEWASKNSKENGAYQAARRALAWVTIIGTADTRNMRGWDEGYISVGSGDFSDIEDDSTESYATVIYGSSETHDVLVPGWGQIPESNSVDIRLDVSPTIVPGRYVSAEVKYKFPLLMPIAANLISHGKLDEFVYTEEDGDVKFAYDGFPYFELKETCVLPAPYSTERLPLNAYDYTSYD